MEDGSHKIISAIQTLNAEICDALHDYNVENDNYYKARLASGLPISDRDAAIIVHILASHSVDLPIVDVGAGIGQLALALACFGQKAIAVEEAATRSEWAIILKERLMPWHPQLHELYSVYQVRYPHSSVGEGLLVFSNVANTGWDNFVRACGADSAIGAHRAVIDLQLWGRIRSDREVEDLKLDFTAAGRKVTQVSHYIYEIGRKK